VDVFSAAIDAGGAFLRDAAIAAAHDLGVLVARPANPTHRMRALLAVIDALGVTSETPRPSVPAEGWGRLAEVIRTDRPLPIDPAHEHGYQRHLLAASAPAARELVGRLPAWLGRTPRSLIDLGGGAGAYTAAFLDAYPDATATLVDVPAVAELARVELARFGDRVRIIAGDARDVIAHDRIAHDSIVHDRIARDSLAHDRIASDAPGDLVEHDVALLANVLHLHGPDACAELCAAAARAGELVIVKDLDPETLQGKLFALGMAVYTERGAVYPAAEIRACLTDPLDHRLEATPDGLVVTGRRARPELAAAPPAFRRVLERAFAASLSVEDRPMPRALEATARALLDHYTVTMPARRREQLARLQAPVPSKLRAAIAGLDAVLADAGVPPVPDEPTLAALYERTYYGELMPMLHGDRDDLVAPMIHELCHLGRARTPIDPPHLDECLTGWLGVYAYPATLVDIYGAPWLAQVGQAIARTFGVRATIRAHAGLAPLPAWFTRAAEALGWDDWQQRRSVHLLADTMDPAPWVALARSRGVPEDPAFDRQIVEDALRSMCLVNSLEEGRFVVRVAPPEAPIVIDDGWMTTAPRGIDRIPPRYWVPLEGRHELRVRDLGELVTLAAELTSRSRSGVRPR
jgi:hypothetical protein